VPIGHAVEAQDDGIHPARAVVLIEVPAREGVVDAAQAGDVAGMDASEDDRRVVHHGLRLRGLPGELEPQERLALWEHELLRR